MVKETVKGASARLLCWAGLMAVVCIPSFIAGVTCTQPDGAATLLNATATGLKSDVLSPANAVPMSATIGRVEQPGLWRVVKVHVGACCPGSACCRRDSNDTIAREHELQPDENIRKE